MARTGREELATRADFAEFELRLTNRLYAVAVGIAAVTIVAVKLIP